MMGKLERIFLLPLLIVVFVYLVHQLIDFTIGECYGISMVSIWV